MTGIHSELKIVEFKSDLERGREVLEEEMTEALSAAKGKRTNHTGLRSAFSTQVEQY